MRSQYLQAFAVAAELSRTFAAPTHEYSQSSLVSAGKHHKGDDDYNLEPSAANFAFAGITTFSKLPQTECLLEEGPVDDILILGFPFDTATSYRTGTRFGPNAIRQGSRAASLAFVSFF